MQHNEIIRKAIIRKKHVVLRRVTNYSPSGLKENSFFIVEFDSLWDYPLYHNHTDSVVWDSCRLPKDVRKWTTKQLQNLNMF